ncbi:F420-0:gamma-glutamyl ligase [Clostridium acetireducens DSM 10703]|jgi:F420-0:gamma-glutamyl ligase|uniref:F420-0:gamma-glutamyl ligase n=1 Tax=Clostridium acetireducens DSM 10703 TaxID=1121290 RepID=A0A1E8EVV4_9CLOT|nr:coenzyme F420-0:L-glutamate ligase [Clostridium acetireducens]OFH99383.1 F420-0:gamma-glutamyl ligase [Clostridium acetireducens DSM 10703]
MARTIGTTVRGIRIPIIKEGDDLAQIVVNSLLEAAKEEGFQFRDRDVIGITESVLARAQGNYVTIYDIAKDINEKFTGDIGIVFPILSRNRFSMILKGIAESKKKIYMLLSYPSDEVGNHLMDIDEMDKAGINPYTDVLSEEDYRKYFGEVEHKFTGVDYVQMYKELANNNIEVYFSNNPRTILKYTKEVIAADIHSRKRTKRILKEAGAEKVYGLDDICNKSINGNGYNPQYGLLGSNKATEDKLKLFPKDCDIFVKSVQNKLKEATGKNIEVMVYGDGAFKDPVGKIWELADPVVSPAFTEGLVGRPNEIKLKYIADNKLKSLDKKSMEEEMKKLIKEKGENLLGTMESQGTTPRQLTDLLGSLCDLTSGSGDKGTPVVLIQGYFDSYAND